jgi:hypothetical protein
LSQRSRCASTSQVNNGAVSAIAFYLIAA